MTKEYQISVLEALVDRMEEANRQYSMMNVWGEKFEEAVERKMSVKGGERMIRFVQGEIEKLKGE